MFNYLSERATAFKNPTKCFNVLEIELNFFSKHGYSTQQRISKYVFSTKACLVEIVISA